MEVAMSVLQHVLKSIFPQPITHIEVAMGGISTTVYRLRSNDETFYLRLLPDPHDTFAAEYAIHNKLQALGVQVPDVLHFERHNPLLKRSLMITTAIKGQPVIDHTALDFRTIRHIIRDAGRDVALLNTVLVNATGRLRHYDTGTPLFAPYSHVRPQILANDNWHDTLQYLARHVLSRQEMSRLERVLALYDAEAGSELCYLAHGDFSKRHIYQENGRYTGIIDFGDSLGTNQWYDLGHFHLRDSANMPYTFTNELLQGYQEVITLPDDYMRQIRFASILIAAPLLARAIQHNTHDPYNQKLYRVFINDITFILDSYLDWWDGCER